MSTERQNSLMRWAGIVLFFAAGIAIHPALPPFIVGAVLFWASFKD